MKSFTDLPQSKKLAEILPIESADMCWCNSSIKGINYTDEYSANLYTVKEMKDVFDEALNGWDKYWKLIPCWSLAALLDVIPQVKLDNIMQYNKKHWRCCAYFASDWHNSDWYDNPIDACVDMIEDLHEQKLL